MEDLILSSIDSEVRVVALEIIKTQFPNRWQQMDFNHKNGLPRKGLVLPHNKKFLFCSKITVLLFLTEIGPFFIKKTVLNRILKYLENDGHGDGEVVSLLALYWTNEFEYD